MSPIPSPVGTRVKGCVNPLTVQGEVPSQQVGHCTHFQYIKVDCLFLNKKLLIFPGCPQFLHPCVKSSACFCVNCQGLFFRWSRTKKQKRYLGWNLPDPLLLDLFICHWGSCLNRLPAVLGNGVDTSCLVGLGVLWISLRRQNGSWKKSGTGGGCSCLCIF